MTAPDRLTGPDLINLIVGMATAPLVVAALWLGWHVLAGYLVLSGVVTAWVLGAMWRAVEGGPMSLDVYLTMPDCAACNRTSAQVFSANITHNLGKMAADAGLYNVLWRPDEHGMRFAGDLIAQISAGLGLLESDPDRFRKFDSPNGWGLYEHFVPWVRAYLEACRQYPTATVEVWR